MKFIRLLLIFTIMAMPAIAQIPQQQWDVWIQYSLTDGSQQATNSQKVSDADLAVNNEAQIEYRGDPTGMMVDITQNPPAVVSVPQGTSPDVSGPGALTPCN